MMDGAFEDAVVVRPGGGEHAVLRRFGGGRLQKFLQFALGIFKNWNDAELSKSGVKLPKDEFAGGVKTAIEKHSAKQRLESIGERRQSLATAVLAHRLVVDPQAKFAGTTAHGLVGEILKDVPVPA